LSANGSKRVIVLGAGTAGANLLKSLGRSPEWTFVGLLDDDPARQGRDIDGVKVLGALETLSEVARASGSSRPSSPCRARHTLPGGVR